MVWGIIAVAAVAWFYMSYLSPRASALREARKLFRPVEVELALQCFGRLCNNLIIATPKGKRSGIEISIYVGQCVGETCSIRLSFSNFSYRNIRDMLPAYLYAQQLGWEDGDGLLCYKSDGIEIASDYDDITYGEAFADRAEAAYRALIEVFQNHCPSVRQSGHGNVSADGVFLKFVVSE